MLANEELDNNLVLSVLYNLLTNDNKNFDFDECSVENDLMNSIINVLKRIDIEDNNLKYVFNRYLGSFREFVEKMEDVNIVTKENNMKVNALKTLARRVNISN